jgi:hypothetical protein
LGRATVGIDALSGVKTLAMRKNMGIFLGCGIAATASLLYTGCLKDKIRGTETYTVYTPVYALKSAVRAAINGDQNQPVAQAGQLYTKGSYIYLNDIDKGIHIIDNSDPRHPIQTAFLNIPGNENIAIRGNILYADMYTDLLAIDISNPHQAKITGTLWGFFTGRYYGSDSNSVVTSWIKKDTSFQTGTPGSIGWYLIPNSVFYASSAAAAPAAAANLASTSGTGGSTATMTLIGDYLYAIPEEHSLGVVKVADSSQPVKVNTMEAGFDLETIFPLQNNLLLGSKEGVYIYSIANAVQPVEVSEFTHGTACDPVIADQDYAYVTLHSGTGCGGSANEMDVLTAKNISQAILAKTYPMTSPSGLCKDGSLLFVCDGPVVKAFDASDPMNLQLLTELKVSNAADVIAANHLLIVVSTGGLYQYDYSDPNNIVQLSYLAVK